MSHQEQMSLIIRYIDMFICHPVLLLLMSSFLGFFLNVSDTTGQGLFDVLQMDFGLDIVDVRGQGYDMVELEIVQWK